MDELFQSCFLQPDKIKVPWLTKHNNSHQFRRSNTREWEVIYIYVCVCSCSCVLGVSFSPLYSPIFLLHLGVVLVVWYFCFPHYLWKVKTNVFRRRNAEYQSMWRLFHRMNSHGTNYNNITNIIANKTR